MLRTSTLGGEHRATYQYPKDGSVSNSNLVGSHLGLWCHVEVYTKNNVELAGWYNSNGGKSYSTGWKIK